MRPDRCGFKAGKIQGQARRCCHQADLSSGTKLEHFAEGRMLQGFARIATNLAIGFGRLCKVPDYGKLSIGTLAEH